MSSALQNIIIEKCSFRRVSEILTNYFASASLTNIGEPEKVAEMTGLTIHQVNGWLDKHFNET